MEKIDGRSFNVVEENVNKLKELFPEINVEGKIDFDKLKKILGNYIESNEEHYKFTWYGKNQSYRNSQISSIGTLRPCKEESKDFENTKNLYIEGDNLEVLKLLQKSYRNKVKMIYIDPPYNKDKDFIYTDKWKDPIKNYKEITKQIDEEGNLKSSDSEIKGSFHTNWLNMIYPRLLLARNLLKDDGVIFISIDDNEVHNLRKVCDEIFGDENFLINFSWRTDGNFDNQAKFKKCHEYILVYAKQEKLFNAPPVIDPNIPKTSKLYKKEIRNTIIKNGPKNPISNIKLPIGFPADFAEGTIEKRVDIWPHYHYDAVIKNSKLTNEINIESGWSSRDLLLKYISNDCKPVFDNKGQESRFIISVTGAIEVIKKRNTQQSHVISSLNNLGGPQKANIDIQALGVIFDDYPKPIILLKYLCKMLNEKNGIILDFFAGSATTAHAIMDLNAEDNGCRKFIMIQLPESCKKKSEAYKAGYENICEIGKERIRRAGKKIKEDNKDKENIDKLDIGFKVLKLDSSNLKKWDVNVDDAFYNKSEEEQNQILLEKIGTEINNFNKNRKDLDIVYEIMLKYGLDLTYPIIEKNVKESKIFDIGNGALIICLDLSLSIKTAENIIEYINEIKPSRVRIVVRDNAMKNINIKNKFKSKIKEGIDIYFENDKNKQNKEQQYELITI